MKEKNEKQYVQCESFCVFFKLLQVRTYILPLLHVILIFK